MMASSPKDPLDVLQAMFDEVVCTTIYESPSLTFCMEPNAYQSTQLVQTGKALRASRKDGSKNVVSGGTALRTKMPETMTTFHYALDDLESEIVRFCVFFPGSCPDCAS